METRLYANVEIHLYSRKASQIHVRNLRKIYETLFRVSIQSASAICPSSYFEFPFQRGL